MESELQFNHRIRGTAVYKVTKINATVNYNFKTREQVIVSHCFPPPSLY